MEVGGAVFISASESRLSCSLNVSESDDVHEQLELRNCKDKVWLGEDAL